MKNPAFPSLTSLPRLGPGAALLLAIVMATVACSTAPPRQSALISSAPDIEMPTTELRLRVYGYAEQFAGDVEEAADRILKATDDRAIERQALRWKINIASVTQVAAFALDPLIGLYDMWALAMEMRQFFETGSGREVFGEHQPIAIETSRELEGKANELARSISVSGDPSGPRREIEAYAAAHPITDMHFVRETATKEFADLLAQDQSGGLAVLGDLAVQFGDLSERLKFYAASLPNQSRWQAELLLLDILDEQAIDEFLGNVESIDVSALRLADFADTLPAIIDEQATEAIRVVGEEAAIALSDVDRQRIETLEWFTKERIVVIDDLVRERIAVMEDLAAITDSAMRGSTLVLDDAVDRAFYRALQLLAVIFIGGLLWVFLVRLIWKRPSVALIAVGLGAWGLGGSVTAGTALAQEADAREGSRVDYDRSTFGTRWLESERGTTIKILVEAANLGGSEVEIGEITFPGGPRPPGQGHLHGSIEIFYVLSGEMNHVVNGESHILKPGMVGIVRPGDRVAHGVSSAEPVRALVIWAPGGEADRIAPYFEERSIEPDDVP